jgi:hypothetical protein
MVGGARERKCVGARVAIISMQRVAILSSAASLAPPHFWKSHKRQDFQEKKNTEHEIDILIFSVTSPILRRFRSYTVINVETSSSKVPAILVGF